jgi:acetyl esterase
MGMLGNGLEELAAFWKPCGGGKHRSRADPYASPLRAADLGGLPPATIITAEIDPLRSDGEAYAKRLEEAGVAVEYRAYAGVTHEFFGM